LDAIQDDRVVVSYHAAERGRDRKIEVWQVVSESRHARLMVERPETTPNPTIELAVILIDGTRVKAVWAFIVSSNHAKLVTIHFFDR
jgi:hypothetical protein